MDADQYFFLVMIAQNSSKENSSFDSVWLRMWVLCIISMIYSSVIVSPSSRQTRFTFSKSIEPICSWSYRLKIFVRPYFVRVSPNLLQTTSRKSSKPICFPLPCRSWIIWKTDSLRLSSPSSCKIFWISAGSMSPVPSSSKRSKVLLSSCNSCCASFSRAGITTGTLLLGVFVRIFKFIATVIRCQLLSQPSIHADPRFGVFLLFMKSKLLMMVYRDSESIDFIYWFYAEQGKILQTKKYVSLLFFVLHHFEHQKCEGVGQRFLDDPGSKPSKSLPTANEDLNLLGDTEFGYGVFSDDVALEFGSYDFERMSD